MADTSYYAKKKEEHDRKIQEALESRNKRIRASLPDTLSEIQDSIDAEVAYYNKGQPVSGSYTDVWNSQRERRLSLSKLREKISAYSKYMSEDYADYANALLNKMERDYDSAVLGALTTPLNKYSQMVKNEEYLSKEDQDAYSKAAQDYITIGEQLLTTGRGYSQSEIDKFRTGTLYVASGATDAWKLYSDFETEDDYNFWHDRNTVEKRQALYNSQKDRLAELEKKLAGLDASPAPQQTKDNLRSSWETEAETLRTEIANYERGNSNENGLHYGSKVVDDYYNITQRTDFATTSANRDYKNPTREEIDKADVMNDSSTWKWDDATGTYRDSFGNELAVDGNNTYYNPVAQQTKVADKLALYFDTSEDERVQIALDTHGYRDGILKSVMSEGYTGAWEYLNDEELGIYYTLLGESQEKAYQYLSDMNVELNRRRTLDEQGKWNTAYNDANFLEKILLNAATVPSSLLSGVSGFIEDTVNTATGKEINPYSLAHSGTHFSNTIRGATANDLDGIGFDFFDLGDLYQSGMSMADSLAAVAAFGGFGGVILATGAAEQEAIRLYESGASNSQITWGAATAGAAELIFESISIGNLKKIKNMKSPATLGQYFKTVLVQAGVEGSEEMLTEIANTVSNAFIMGSQSDWAALMDENSGNFGKALLDKTLDVLHAGLSGAVSGGGSGGIVGGISYAKNKSGINTNAKERYGGVQKDLVGEALEINPDNAFAKRMQGKLDKGKDLSGARLNRLVQQNEAALTEQDKATIQSAAEARLTELGETGDVSAVAAALAKQAAGEKLSRSEQKLISESKYGQRVANELNTDNIKSGEYSTAWAEKLDTERINVEEYSRLVKDAELTGETAETTGGDVATDVPKAAMLARDGSTPVSTPTISSSADAATGKKSLQVEKEAPAAEEPKAKSVTIEDASKKYGAQAQAMAHTYKEGQDVGKFDNAYRLAYNWGQSGVSPSYVNRLMDENAELSKSENVVANVLRYLTKEQVQLAYEAGQAASDTTAKEQDAKNKAAANGKTGRKRGTVRGDGVKIADLKETFNDTQGKAYKYLVDVADATGIDIVLYRSEAGKDGKFRGEQGKYDRNDPGTIYIDLNAGLRDVDDAKKLHRYAMLRTFSHEFTHFIENWNPIQYNELRKAVFEAQESRGVDVHARILEKQNKGLSYEKASREVVAESMTDILPDSNFVQDLAENHKNIFQKLLEKLKEFVNNLKDYYKTVGGSYYEGATALKEQVGDTVKYLDNIVKLFDQAAVQAVENFQQTVAINENIQEVQDNGTREETREAFIRRAGKALLEVGERGSLAFGYRRYSGQLSQNIQEAEEGLKERGIPVVVFEQMEGNKKGITTIYSNDALAIPGVAVFIHKDAVVSGLEIVGHEGYHYLARTDNRIAYDNVLAANIDFASKAFIEYQEKYVEDIYFADDVEIGSKEWNTLMEEIFAYITGDINAGDPRGEVHAFLRDYDAVEAALDSLFEKQTAPAATESVEESAPVAEKDTYGFTISDNVEHGSLEITFDSKPSDAVRDVLKENKFRWHKAKKVWYGYGSREDIQNALHAAYKAADTADKAPEQSDFEKSFWNATQAERDEVVDAIHENTKISHVNPTEIRESADMVKDEEVTENGQNVDNRTAVQQPEPDGSGAAPVLDELQTGDVPGDGGSRDTVADAGERGQQTVRDGSESDHRTGDVGGHGEGSSQSGDLRGSDRVTEESVTDNNVGDKSATTGEDTNVPSKETEKLHEEVVEQIAQQSTEKPKGRNFVIGDSLDLPNGEKARYKANIEAIRLVKQLEAEGRYATEAEQAVLSKYVGWGGLANAFDQRKAEWAKEYAELKELLTDEEYTSARGSTLNAHYTDISVIKAMYDGLKQLGFTGGRMMEPSSGVGNFVGAMPADMASQVRSWTMVELDGITGLIAKYLYPNADVRIQGFEKANIPNNFMDVAISNVPFGNYPIADKSYPKKVTSAIHNYFFAKSLDKVRPGGIVMFITSSYTMNSSDSTVRRYIMQKADLLGAIRLPDSAFKGNAGTEVVTDILVLKKRADNTAYAGEDFLEAPYKYINGYNGAYINSYFDNHPEMVLGTASMEGGMYRGSSLTYKAFTDKGSLADQIREAFKNIQGKMDYPVRKTPEKTNFAVERAGKKTKNNGLVVKDGKVYQNKNGELQEVTVAKGVADRITGMLEIRDAAKELQTYLQQGLKDTEIRKARAKLNKAYDAFVKKHGFINSQTNRNAIKPDPDSFSILALENWNPETKKATKADIFSKNTIAPNRTVTSAKDVAEGLIVSVNQTGGVDAALIAKLTGKTEADVTRELLDSRAVFKNRDGSLETAEIYLSGNVRAKLRDAEAMVPLDADYQKNVEALKAVVPEDVGYQDIFVNPGTPWIPNSVYSDFAAYMLGTSNSEWSHAVDVTRNRETGNFTVELKNRYLKSNSYNTQKWGTNRRSFLDLFDAMLNSKSVVVKYKTDDGKTVVDQDATAAANEKVEAIQKEFQEWLWKDEGRRNELATLYNETFNSVVTPKYNGDNLTVNGANAMKPLRPHQRNAVQRVISSGGNTLLAHKVGAGKTYEMAAAAMKLKELGLVKKPLFAVPKSLVAQWGNEFMDFFPTAKLLVAEAGDFTAANRKIFANRIANGDYDAVIVSYEQFEKLPISADFARELYQEQIESVIAAIEDAKAEKGGRSLSVKDLEKKRKSLQTKIEKLTDSAKDEDNIEFEQLGVDSIFVDEAHNFKNLFYTTSMTNVSGLGNKDGSKRAFDLYTKVRYLQKLNGGRGIVFATATPVMNSMSEMYIMQKYLQPDLLDQLGLNTFDAWAKQFGEVVNGVEIKPSGQGYRVKQSFSRFKNMSELQLLFRNFADVLTDIPGLKIPKMKGGRVNVVVCEPGQFQQDYMKELEKRADNIKNVDPSVDNMLKITSDGRKISYTQRMIDPSLPYEEGCKIFRCADNVVRVYQENSANKGTQLIFCDMATPKGKSKAAETQTEEIETDMESAKLYDDIKARLMKGGIPAKEIAFIHEADTDAKKKKLFADVNDGKVRVLIGSTGKMGVGMNAQKRIVAIHHLDAPWRPGDVEQRNGRAYRQGNINDEVENFTYVTEGSFDARLWDILDRKQSFINQVMNGENVGRETEDTGEVTLSAAEVKALASGSPLIMEQVQLDTDIKKLESLRRAHRAAVTNAMSRLQADKGRIATLEKMIENGKADAAARIDTYSEGKFSITIGKQKFTDKKDAGVALMAEATAKANEAGYTTIGQFAGFDLRVIKTHEGIKGLISGNQGYSFNTYPGNTTYMVNHLVARVEGISETVTQWEQELVQTRKDMAEQETLITQPFAKQAELDQKRARYNEVMEILNPKEEQALDSVAEDDVQYQSRDYLSEDEDYDQRGIQTGTQKPAELYGKSEGQAAYGEGNRTDGRGSTGNKAWEKLSKRDKNRILTALQSMMSKPGRYEEMRAYRAAVLNKPVIDMTLADKQAADEIIAKEMYSEIIDRNNSRASMEVQWSLFGDISPIVEAIYGENVQFQQRTDTLTDRDVLMLAASEVNTGNWSDAEKYALDTFQKRLSNLETLQEERTEQGRLYKEQQFGSKVDRAAAAQTLNRMHVLDGQIQKASADVLDIENKEVLRRVLKKARSVVEQQDRQHFQQIMKRKIDRMHNAAAIKKYRDRLRGDVDELTNWVLHPDNKNVVKHIPDALKNTMIPFLSSINFMSKRSLAGGNHTQADKALMEQSRRLAKVMEKTVDLDEMYSNYTDLPPDFMKKLRSFIDTAQEIVDENSGDFIINQMTAEDLKNLSHVVRTLKKYIMEMNRFHVNQMFKHVYDAGESSINFLTELKSAENTGAISQFLLWQQMRPAYAFERFGKGGMAIYDGLRRGQATLAFNTKRIMEFSEKAYTTAEVKAWENQVKTIRIGPGKTVTMRVSQIMSLYELNKRKQAQGHIFGEGIRVATFKNGKKKISDIGQTLTPGELNMILRELTPRQKEVADKLQQFMEKQGGEWGNYVTVARFGEKQFGEENYFPINSDGRHLQVDADEKPGASALYALLNMSFTKQTQEKAKNRLIVYSIFDVFSNHMASMAQYNAFALPVVDALKWFNYQRVAIDEDGTKTLLASVREQMDRAFGVPEENRPGSGRRGYAQNFVINIIKALNGTEAQGTAYDSFGLKALHRYNRGQVAYNLRVVMQQPMAITRAAQLLDYASILKGLKLQPAAIRKNIQEMQQYSGIAAWKSLGFYDVNISRGLTSIIKHDDTWVDKVSDVGMWGAEKADTLTWAAIWSAAKEEVIRKQKLTPKSEGFYDAVAKLFEDVIYKTQVVDSVLTKNEFMRDKGFFARSVSSFMSEAVTTASMLIDAYDKYHMDIQRGMTRQQAWKKNGKMIVRTAYVYGVGAVLLAAVQAVADAFRDDDEYEEWYEKWLEAFYGNLIDELMPFNKLPIVSDFYDLVKEILSKLGVDTYGNPPQSVYMQWYDSLVKGMEIMYDKISGADTNYTWYGGAYKLLQAISGMTGLPMAGATREIVTAWNNIVGAMAPSLKVKTYDAGGKNEIKYAYQDGYLTAEEAAQELLDQGLVDSEDEAYFTVQGWEAGDDYSRYDAIFDAVRNGGDFDAAMNELTSHGYTEKEVLAQVKGQIGEWYKGGEITKQQAIDMLTKYFDMDSEEITATVNKWSSKVVTGIAYEDIKDEFLAGNITASRAIEMRMRYGGESREDAQNTVGEWAFEAEHPELDGVITYTQYKRWETDGKPKGVSLETFTDVAEFRNNGTDGSVKSQEEVAAYIDALNISKAQKDALWCCFWKESTLKNAPWRK